MNRTSPVLAMVWKEVRENLKWAALGCLGMTIALVYVLWEHGGAYRWAGGEYRGTGTPLLADEFLAVTTIAGAALPLLLAIAQTLPEKRPDHWAFLVHRPTSRTRLLLGKALAGLGLYALAVGLPFAGAVAWVATPGNVPAPFQPGMVLPGLADLLCGVAYYAVGLLIGLRDARWYGSRVFVAGLGVVCGFVVAIMAREFWHALLGIAVTAAVLGTAAWGSFLAGGRYDPQPRAAKVSLGATLLAGILLAGAMLVGLATALLPGGGTHGRTLQYTIDANGNILRFPQRGGPGFRITDLSGNVPPEYADSTNFGHEELYGSNEPSAYLGIGPRSSSFPWPDGYRSEGRFYTRLDRQATGSERWFLLNDGRYGVGYSATQQGVVGYFGPRGFTGAAGGPPAERFVTPPGWTYALNATGMLVSPAGVHLLDLEKHSIREVFAPPAGRHVAAGWEAYRQVERSPGETETSLAFRAFATAAPPTAHVIAPDGRTLFTTPLEHTAADGYGQVTVLSRAGGTRYFLWYQPMDVGPAFFTTPQHVTELTPAGQVVARHELPPVGMPEVQPRPGEETLVAAAVPLAGYAAAGATVWLQGGSVLTKCNEPPARRAFGVTLIVGVLCALLTFALGRRHAFPNRPLFGWTATNLLLGPAGVLTMVALRSWPARERCASCGRKGVVTSERCPSCAAPPIAPALDGTEIFA